MTEPVYTYPRWTLEQECCAQGIQVPEGPLTCDHHCGRLCEANALFDAHAYPELSGDWVCITCFSRIDREDAIATELASAPAPSWASTCEHGNGVRADRQRRLLASDWTQLPDVSTTVQTAWAAYRQALRDLTITFESPDIVEWPSPPSA